jgi:hypothetical protein
MFPEQFSSKKVKWNPTMFGNKGENIRKSKQQMVGEKFSELLC